MYRFKDIMTMQKVEHEQIEAIDRCLLPMSKVYIPSTAENLQAATLMFRDLRIALNKLCTVTSHTALILTLIEACSC